MKPILLRVGRGENDGNGNPNDIIINDSSISRAHLEVFIDIGGNVFITDLNSTNGTFVNGVALKGDTMLRKGDVLKLGNSQTIHWEDWKNYGIEENTSSSTASPSPTDSLESLSVPQKKKSKLLSYLIAGAVILIIISCTILLVFKDRIFGTPNSYENVVFNKSKVESMTFEELQKSIEFHPKVFELNDSDRIKTIDYVDVILLIKENKLNNIIKAIPNEEVVEVVKTEPEEPIINTGKSTTGKQPSDRDRDGVPDEKDSCPDEKGSPKNNGCIDTSKTPTTDVTQQKSTNSGALKKNSDGSYEVNIAASGETIKALIKRIKGTSSFNCSNPGDAEEIVILNKTNNKIKSDVYQKMKEDETYVVPGGTPIKFRCN